MCETHDFPYRGVSAEVLKASACAGEVGEGEEIEVGHDREQDVVRETIQSGSGGWEWRKKFHPKSEYGPVPISNIHT